MWLQPKRRVRQLRHKLGGGQRATAVVLFALALALETADLTAIGALAPQLQSGLRITNAQLGLLATVSTFVSGLLTIPFGVLADRVRRVTLMWVAIATWTVAMALCAVAQSYLWLLLARVGLGGVTAAALPAIASMVGDSFAPGERARIYGYIYTGELLGTGFGFVVCGLVGGAFGWRWGFVALAVPAMALALATRQLLQEPARGASAGSEPQRSGEDQLTQQIRRRKVAPRPQRVAGPGLARASMRRVTRHVLSIPTIRWVIVANSVGYLFFAGLRTFGLEYVRGHFGLSQGAAVAALFVAGVGSVAGVLIAGRTADRQIRRGRVSARIVVAAALYLLAPLFLAPALALPSIAAAMPLLILGAFALSGPNAPLDAAMLDVVPGPLWGRAAGIRTVVRQTAQAGGPLLFALMVDLLAGSRGNVLASGSAGKISAATAHGLELAFLVGLIPLVVNGILLLSIPLREYRHDVAASLASEEVLAGTARAGGSGASKLAPVGSEPLQAQQEQEAEEDRHGTHQPDRLKPASGAEGA